MAFSITTFKANMTGGGARPNLFEFNLTLPSEIGLDTGTMNDKLKFFAKGVSIPSSDVAVIKVPYFGREVNMLGDRTFQPITATIINDEDFALRKVFEEWMGKLRFHTQNLTDERFLNPNNYRADGEVIQYSKSGKAIMTYKFVGLVPVTLSEIALDWGSSNAIEEYTVQFELDYWSRLGDSGSLTFIDP